MDKQLICLQVFDVVTLHIITGVLKPLFEKSFMKRFLFYIQRAFTVLCLVGAAAANHLADRIGAKNCTGVDGCCKIDEGKTLQSKKILLKTPAIFR